MDKMQIDIALLILRLVVGGIVAAHGAQKLFGSFGGPGLAGSRKMVTNQRLRPVGFWGPLAGLSEFGGGVLLALGFLSPLGPLGVVAAMAMAILLAHWLRFWASKGGMEFPLTLLAVGLSLGLTGPGSYSLDNLLGLSLSEPQTFLIGLLLVAVGIAIALATRTAAPTSAPASAPAPSTGTGENKQRA